MDIIELLINDEDSLGVEAISLVEFPAIEEDFIALSKQKVEFKKIDEDKRIIIGLALIPNKPIYRKNEDKEYYIYFSKETVRKSSELFLKNNRNNEATLEHNLKANGVSVIESWIVEDVQKDKTALYGLNAVEGSWAVVMKIYNDEIWEDVKLGKYKGLSIEGYYADKVERPKEPIKDLQAELSAIEEAEAEYLLSQVKAIIKSDKRLKQGKRTEMESFSDYPESVSNNAKRGIELNEKVNNRCATQVGKVRAQQLAQGKPISMETIKRMFSYLSRAEVYYEAGDTESCGYISYLLWGGKSAKSWAESKIKSNG
jgi:hypothetical protein